MNSKISKETKKEKLGRMLAQKALQPRAISTFRKWKIKQEQDIAREKQKIVDRLLRSIPAATRVSLGITKGDVRRIVNDCPGYTTDMVYWKEQLTGDRPPLSQSKVKKILPSLKRAWKDVVKIRVEFVGFDETVLKFIVA